MVMDMGRDAGQGVVELAYRPTLADYVTALRERRKVSRSGRRQPWLIGGSFVCFGVSAAVRLAGGHVPSFLLIWFVAFGLVLGLSPRLQARQLFRLSQRNGAHRVTVTDGGLTLVTDNTSTTVNWTAQPRYRETGDAFVLFSDDKHAARITVLPKRGILAPADADGLREMLDRGLTRV